MKCLLRNFLCNVIWFHPDGNYILNASCESYVFKESFRCRHMVRESTSILRKFIADTCQCANETSLYKKRLKACGAWKDNTDMIIENPQKIIDRIRINAIRLSDDLIVPM